MNATPATVVVTELGRPLVSYLYVSRKPGDVTLASVPMFRLAADVPQVQVVVPSGSLRVSGRESRS